MRGVCGGRLWRRLQQPFASPPPARAGEKEEIVNRITTRRLRRRRERHCPLSGTLQHGVLLTGAAPGRKEGGWRKMRSRSSGNKEGGGGSFYFYAFSAAINSATVEPRRSRRRTINLANPGVVSDPTAVDVSSCLLSRLYSSIRLDSL